ncbi:MAG: ABC transporter ATP-binding protein [Thermotogae bacterium]|uniref:ABC transporter ATP-binding protein n=1 Tax=Kosmotoga sp. TaxID=1955248 RepID=UPI000F1ED090|nr:ABC transporter ATP-binding protein [Kosmotoga sp.]MCD6160767.1 ABC transporter ATP-binding protein [Kosmotoga sp.]RKX50507.1 MAG: ABC transporter ATP-binding protein [Thermotogota bacterium]
MLEIKNIEVYYGYVKALKDISLRVEEGQIVSLLGSNGAGKTTTLKTISGLLKPKSGSILFHEKIITHLDSSAIVRMGIVQCPEGRQLFPDLSVKENLLVGAITRKNRKQINDDLNQVYGLFPILRDRKNQLAGTLSGGEQQMLAIGRALMAGPKLLMLDEPSLGLAPKIVEQIFELLVNLNKEKGLTILLVEQNANAALRISDYAYILEVGTLTLEGDAKDLLKSELVQQKYLGA